MTGSIVEKVVERSLGLNTSLRYLVVRFLDGFIASHDKDCFAH